MPRLVSAGLWRDVTLKIENPVSIIDAHWMTYEIDVPGRKAKEYVYLQTRMPFEAFDNVNAVVIISRPTKHYKTKVVSAGEKEADLNTADKFIQYVQHLKY